jgi:hypothetical protein
MGTDIDKSLWTWESSLQDHVRVIRNAPMNFLAPFVLTPKESQAVQLAMNSVNRSNISTVWHVELGRLAGLTDPEALDERSELAQCDFEELEMFASYGQAFAFRNGYGDEVKELFYIIYNKHGIMKAVACQAVAFMELWLAYVGNTLLAFLRGTLRRKKRQGQSLMFEVIFFLWYIIPYLMVAIAALIIKALPSPGPEPSFLFRLLNILIATLHNLFVTVFIIPYAIMGIMAFPVFGYAIREPLRGREGYQAIGSDTFSIEIKKSTKDAKVGVRFQNDAFGNVKIRNIDRGSLASKASLRVGTFVFPVNGTPVVDMQPDE